MGPARAHRVRRSPKLLLGRAPTDAVQSDLKGDFQTPHGDKGSTSEQQPVQVTTARRRAASLPPRWLREPAGTRAHCPAGNPERGTAGAARSCRYTSAARAELPGPLCPPEPPGRTDGPRDPPPAQRWGSAMQTTDRSVLCSL